MLRRCVRDILRSFLRRFDRELVFYSADRVCGYELHEDIRTTIRKNNPVCFDVGANTGQTIGFLLSVFPDPQIYSFEPVSETYEILHSKYKTHPRVNLFRLALGNRNGTQGINLYGHPTSTMHSFFDLDRGAENRFRDLALVRMETVCLSTLDSFLNTHPTECIDLLKLDAQGYEFKVLQGAEKAFADCRIRNVLIEMNFVKVYIGQSDVLDIFDFLRRHGLHFVDFYDKRRQGPAMAYCNALFTRTDKSTI